MRWFYGLIVALVPFVLQYNYIINTFYHTGAVYFDAGLFANLTWRNDVLLTCSRLYGEFSYLGVHFSVVLFLLNQLSFLVAAYKVEFFATFIAAIYASLGLAMYYALLVCLKPERHRQVLGLALVAIAFAFNGLVMQGIWMPHFEYALPACIFMFLLHYRLDNRRWALFFFILTLFLREDAGFHIASVLGLLIALDYWRTRDREPLKRGIFILLAGIVYSLFAWWMTFHIRAFYGVEGSVFRQIYTGSPPYAHLSWALLASRLATMAYDKVYLWLALLITLGWTWRTRNPFLLVAFVAGGPWFLLNWASTNDNSGTLYAYYAFPFVLVMGWPLIAVLWRYGPQLPFAARRDALVMQVMLAVAGLIVWNPYAHHLEFGPHYWKLEGSFRLQDSEESREAVRHFTNILGTGDDLGRIMGDAGIASLAVGNTAQNKGRVILWRDEAQPVDTIVYMHPNARPPEKEIRDQIERNHLPMHYCVAGTVVCLYTNRTLDKLGIYTSMLVETPVQ